MLATSSRRRRPQRSATMDLYFDQLRRQPPLDRETEQRLAQAYVKTREPKIAQQLATGHLRLVVRMAREFARTERLLLDLVQEGNLGLLEAIRRYDPERNVRLTSYAGWWIRAYMLKYLMDSARIVRVGRTREDRRLFFQGTVPGTDLSWDDVAAGGSLPFDEDAQVAARPDVAVEREQASAYVKARLAQFQPALAPAEQVVFRERLLCENPRTLREVGKRLSLSGERVRQIEQDLVGRLRTFVGAAAA